MDYIDPFALDEHDTRALRLNKAMYAPVREVPIVITMDDEPMPTPESAMHLAKRLGGVALLIAAVAAAWGAAVYLDPWPWLAAWLAL